LARESPTQQVRSGLPFGFSDIDYAPVNLRPVLLEHPTTELVLFDLPEYRTQTGELKTVLEPTDPREEAPDREHQAPTNCFQMSGAASGRRSGSRGRLFGRLGTQCRVMPAWSGVRPSFLELHALQAITMFVHVVRPP